MRGGVAAALVVGISTGLLIGACMKGNTPGAGRELAQQRKNEITSLSTQIRDWRHEAGMGVEPDARTVNRVGAMTVLAVRKTAMCPAHQPSDACEDVCSLADAICDNAESICAIAAELDGDIWADDKCDSAKASCREAKQRCCSCDDQD